MNRTPPLVPALALAVALGGCGTDVAGPSASFFSCVFSDARALAAGGVLQVRGDGVRSVCLAGGEGGDYLYVPFFATAAPESDEQEVALDVKIMGGGFLDPASILAEGAPILGLNGPRGGRATLDAGFHTRLRQREIEELEPLLRPWPAGTPADPAAAPSGSALRTSAVPVVGELVQYNVAISCTQEDIRTGRVEYVSDHAVVVADVDNPAQLAPEDYAFFGITFDTLVYPVGTAHFGTPSDIDENGRSIIFFTRAVNEMTPHDSQTVTAGFFWSGDLFPEVGTERAEACAAANQAEMFYMLAPDPAGLIGVPFTAEDIRDMSVSVIGHEYQHLINASRRLWVNGASTFERPWLNEGLSHITEELLFYAASGLAPGQNLTATDVRAAPNGVWAFNRYMGANFGNFARFLARPDTASLMGRDNLSTRGATWSFLRYAAGRSGRTDEAFFADVVNSTTAGLENLDAVVGGSALDWMQDWTVSVYADDVVPGLDPRFALRSWDLHDLYINRDPNTVNVYPLQSPLMGSESTLELELSPGGSAYPTFMIGAGGQAAVHIEADGGTPPGSLRGSFLRIR